MFVYEFMENGIMCEWFFGKMVYFLDWIKCLFIVVGLVRGLIYLYEMVNLLIIYCDIKLVNILLDGNYVVKVVDFGFFKLVLEGVDKKIVII